MNNSTNHEKIYSRILEMPSTGCYEWQGAIGKMTGYGKVKIDGKAVDTHRASWIAANGPIAPGLDVCHKCDNRSCVRVSHLFLGTRSENMLDAKRKGRLVTPHLKGEAHGSNIYSAATIEAIYRMTNHQGIPVSEVALLTGVSRGHVWNIKTGSEWGHLTAEFDRP